MNLGKLAAVSILALVGGACGDSDTRDGGGGDGVATVSGRLEMSGSGTTATSASIFSVGDDGETALLASSDIAADGSFQIHDVATGDGPFVVRAEGDGMVVAEVIVPEDLENGDEVTTQPIDGETSVEAQALLSIMAGAADGDDVDTIGLMTWIDGRLAAAVGDGSVSSASLGAAFEASEEAWLEVANQGQATVSAEGAEQAKITAYGELTARLTTVTTAEAAEEAWAEFHADVDASLESSFGMTSAAQADAAAAAGFVFSASLSASAEASDDADRVAAVISSRADLQAQLDAIAGSSAAAEIRAELNAAYYEWFEAAEEADSEAELQAAFEALAAEVSGSGSLTADSALAILVEAEDSGEMEEAVDTIGATASASALLEVKLQQALEGEASARAEAVAEAYAEFRTSVETTVSASANLSARVQAFVEHTASQLGGHGSIVLDIDIDALLGGFMIGGVDLAGSAVAGMGFESGADAAFGDGEFNALIDASTAVLIAISGNGDVSEVDEGEVTGSGWSFEGLAEIGGDLIVELRDASGGVTGAVILDGELAGDGAVTVPAMTEETTVEALVLLDLAANGEAGDDVDRAWLEVTIDAAVAAATDSADDVHALALAVDVSSAVRAEVLGSNAGEMHDAGISVLAELHAELMARGDAAAASWTDFRADLEASVRAATGASAEVYARAETEASVVFEAVVEAVSQDAEVAGAAEARARIESALALETAIGSAFEGSSFASSEADIAAAVDAFIGSSQSASNAAELDAAAEVFVDAIADVDSSGSGSGGILGDIDLGAQIEALLQGVVAGAFQASAAFQASLGAAISGATHGDDIDEGAVANGTAQASATFDGAIDLSALLWGSEDAHAMTTLVTHLALGFNGSYGGGN